MVFAYIIIHIKHIYSKSMPPCPTVDSRTFKTNHTSTSSYETNWTSSWPTNNYGIPQQSKNDAYHSQRLYVTPTSPHAYVNQQPPNPTPFDFNQSVVELFRCQTELTQYSGTPPKNYRCFWKNSQILFIPRKPTFYLWYTYF